MKAPDFAYAKPSSLADALELLADGDQDAMPLAGGQSLVPMLNFRLAAPDTLVDLNGLEELCGIRLDGEVVRIGAMARYAELGASDLVAEHLPLFCMALPHIAHAAVRNRGTIGGSVALADPAAEMPAVLLALDASIRVVGRSGLRTIKADDFFEGLYETALEAGELITEISVPIRKPQDRFGFYELARRHGDYAMTGVAIATAGTAKIDSCRIALFGIGDKAMRATGAEAALRGRSVADALEEAKTALADLPMAADLNASETMKRHLSGVVLERALRDLT